jgi:hypothetical protein
MHNNPGDDDIDKMLLAYSNYNMVMVRGWRQLYSEGPHDLYCLQNIIRVIKSRRIR